MLFGLPLALALAVAPAPPAPAPPWDVWPDLARLAVVEPGDQVLLRSSHCPSGCRYDRTDVGDPRFLRIEGDEQVLFEESGAGAIVRIWMTQGNGVSLPLDPDIRLRVRFDGEVAPRIDLPLADLFNGTRAPFLPPLVSDRLQSSGGYASYVPLAYRRGCKVSLVGAQDKRLWFQFTFHRLRAAAGVQTFRGQEDLSGLSALFARAGEDPWRDGGQAFEHGQATLDPGAEHTLRTYSAPGTVTGLRLHVDPAAWATTHVRLVFDGELRADVPLADFFGATPGPGTRSALIGRDDAGVLYCYFPMPFFHSAELRVRNAAKVPLAIAYDVRQRPGAPLAHSGLFSVQVRRNEETTPGRDFVLLSARGAGRWVGVFADLQSVGTLSREYLEGDERIYVDGSLHPALYGTGVEDLFGGGFYFDQGPFRLATHGAPLHELTQDLEDRTSMYRLFLTDAIPFQAGLRARLESGPTGELSMRARRVVWWYSRDAPSLVRQSTLNVADEKSRVRFGYKSDSAEGCDERVGSFEGEPERLLVYGRCERAGGASHFTFRVAPGTTNLRLRRRFDATTGEQGASVFSNGRYVGRFSPVEPNTFRALREADLDLPLEAAAWDGTLRLDVVPAPGTLPFTEVTWELWTSPQSVERPGAP
jgi:Protein of unknown function (DUF2961)